MLETLISAAIGYVLYSIMWVFFGWYLIYSLWYRKKFITVHEFENSDKEYPNFIQKLRIENVLNYARSYTYSNQFFLSNLRFVFNYNSILKGKNYTKYFAVNSVNTTEITYKNPYGWLIYAGIIIIFGIVLAAQAGSSKNYYRNDSNTGSIILIIFGFLIYAGLFALLWYYTRGYYLVLDNGKVTGLFCRSSQGLENILKTFDKLKLSNETIYVSPQSLKQNERISQDVTCSNCKSVLTLEGDDLKSETFVCPVCHSINSV